MRLALVALALIACSKADEPASQGSSSGSSAGTPAADGPREQVLATWKKNNLDVGAFTKAATDVGKDCATGKVAKLDVLVCVYSKADDAKSSEEFGLGWVGQATGVAQAHGVTLIAVADHAKADPHGKTINQLMKLAPN